MPCSTPSLLVETYDPDLHDRICRVAEAALTDLEACHLPQVNPVVFDFKATPTQSGSVCLGEYHIGDDRISLLTPEAFRKAHGTSDYCETISEAEHFDSIIVHELSHALLDQAPCKETACRADHEYVAYAMQLRSLAKPTRDRFLDSVGLSPPIPEERFNDFILEMSPAGFAAAAWLHFSEPENGCDFVGRIVRGEYSLYQMPY